MEAIMRNSTSLKIETVHPEQGPISTAPDPSDSHGEAAAWHKPGLWVITSGADATASTDFSNPADDVVYKIS
jgi:hypothetical protein